MNKDTSGSDTLASAPILGKSNDSLNMLETNSRFETQQLSADNSLTKTPVEPKDKGHIVYLTFLLYGIGVLLPFSVIMSPLDWYAKTMPDYLVGNIFPFVINGPQWLTQVLLVIYGNNIEYSKRLIPGFAMLAICMLIIPILCNIGGSTGFYSTDAVLVLIGVAGGAT